MDKYALPKIIIITLFWICCRYQNKYNQMINNIINDIIIIRRPIILQWNSMHI